MSENGGQGSDGVVLDTQLTSLTDVVKPNEIQKYVDAVKGWAIFGKHPAIKINGADYEAMKSFYSSGLNKELFYVGEEQGEIKAMRSLVSSINDRWQFTSEGFENPSTNMIVSVTDVGPNSKMSHPNQKLIQIGFFHDNTISKSGRPRSEKMFSLVGLLVTESVAVEFETQIEDNPDSVNELMTKALQGIDSTSDQPGIERYRADSLIYVSNEKLNKIVRGEVDPFNNIQLKTFVESCPKIPFKNGPYGVKDYVK